MKTITCLILVLLLASILLPASQPVTAQAPITVTVSFQNGVSPAAGYTGGRDTTIAEARPDTVFVGESILRLDGDDPPGTGLDLSTLLYWDIRDIPPGSEVKSATIEFTVTNPSKRAYTAYELLKEWTPNQTNWLQRNQGTLWQVPGAAGAEDRGTTSLGELVAGSSKVTLKLPPSTLAVIQKWVDGPQTNYGIILANTGNTDGAALVSSDDSNAANRPKLTITYGTLDPEPPPVEENKPPTVSAGEDFDVFGDISVSGDLNFSLQGTITDDGLPADPGQVTFQWELIREPYTTEPVHLFETETLTPAIEVPKYGYYVFRLTATDGEDTVSDDVQVSVLADPGIANKPPGLYELNGPEEVRLPNTAQYSVYPIDDGLPMPPGDITFTWSTASGPVPVTFSGPHERVVMATFSQPGDYMLQVELSDGELTDIERYPVKVLGETLESRTIHYQQGRSPASSYAGARDTYISQNRPTTNFGGSTKLLVDGDDPSGSGRDLSALLYWDIESFPGDPDRIVEAAITITVTNASKGPFYLYALEKPWSESRATWRLADANSNWSAPGASDFTRPDVDRDTAVLAIFKPTRTGTYTVRLTSEGLNYLKAVLNDRRSNHGFILTHPNTADGLEFHSRNYSVARYRPVLSIRYEVVP